MKTDLDFATIGRRIRERRQKFGMSVQELADLAGVARYTLVRLEKGLPCTPKILERIRRSLHLFTDQMVRPFHSGPFSVHRAAETRWSVSISKTSYQTRVVDDDPQHVDDAEERRRLGALGFQPFFTAILESELSGGVGGHALMELYKPSWTDQHFGEEFVYCLRGSVTMVVDGAECTLDTGDSMSFDATLPHQYLPASPTGPGDPIPLILVVVSLRPGERHPRPPKIE